MNPRLVARVARWAAVAAVVVAAAVAFVFARRARIAGLAQRHAPAAVPQSVAQQSLGFTFSKVEGQQTIFTIRAARATEFTGHNQSLLEDVTIAVNGRHGERHDEIRTHACDYAASTGGIACRGVVEMDLSSVPTPGQTAPAAVGIHIETRNVAFNQNTGEASTDAPVSFRFPQGQGSAHGVTYFSRQSDLNLHSNARITLAPNRPGGPPTDITAGSLMYDRAAQQMRLTDAAQITEGTRTLESAQLILALDNQMRLHHALADGDGRVHLAQEAARAGDPANSVVADTIEMWFDVQGRAERLTGNGHVIGDEIGPGTAHFSADRATVVLDPVSQEAREVQADGDVHFTSKRDERLMALSTASLHLSLVPSVRPGEARIDQAESPGPATTEWGSGGEQLRITAGRLMASFGEDNQLLRLRGNTGVRVERKLTGQPAILTSSEDLAVNFTDGQWADAEESGHVVATQETRTASGNHAHWVRGDDSIQFTGDTRISDPTGHTLADAIHWDQQTGKLHASGQVRSSYVSTGNDQLGAAPSAGPVDVVAQELDANPSSGEAIYSGGARLWQGDLTIQADRIDLERASGTLIAVGNVRAAFPQAQTSGEAVLWRVRAQKLTYLNQAANSAGQGQATLEGNAHAESSQGQIDAKRMVLNLRRDDQGRAELWQAVGQGGVTVRQGQRWGQSDQGVYEAAQGKFVLSGKHPSLHDTTGDLVTGDQLTFYVANDTIQVDSAEGSRTLTEHPVPK